MKELRNLVVLKSLCSVSLIAAVTATLSAIFLSVPVWATFMGWIAFFSRGMTARDALINLICALIGIAMGIVSGLISAALEPHSGILTITVVVFLATFVLMAAALLPIVNNVLAYFLGLVCYFASNLPPVFESWITLAIAMSVGVLGGLSAKLAHTFFQPLLTTSESADHA
tara:strand:- start:1365 stop:1877 length:513 start_codon:yes stop_codon:yes gene_type:complete